MVEFTGHSSHSGPKLVLRIQSKGLKESKYVIEPSATGTGLSPVRLHALLPNLTKAPLQQWSDKTSSKNSGSSVPLPPLGNLQVAVPIRADNHSSGKNQVQKPSTSTETFRVTFTLWETPELVQPSFRTRPEAGSYFLRSPSELEAKPQPKSRVE